jgi:hypothetical protein
MAGSSLTAGSVLAALVLSGCVQTGTGSGSGGATSVGENFFATLMAAGATDSTPPGSGPTASGNSPLVLATATASEIPPADDRDRGRDAPAALTAAAGEVGRADERAATQTTRILLRPDDLTLRAVGDTGNSASGATFKIALPRLTALGDKTAEGDALLTGKVQALLTSAGIDGRLNSTTRTFTLTASPEQQAALTQTLDNLRGQLAFARYGFELWGGTLPGASDATGKLAVAGGQEAKTLQARTVDAASLSVPRLTASGTPRLETADQLVLLGQQAQFAYSAPVDYVATSSAGMGTAGSVNMTVERFPTLLTAQLETRRLAKGGAETTLNLVGKGLARFQDEVSGGLTVKIPLPRTVTARIPFMPVAGKAVVVGGLKGFGRPCPPQAGQYCPYELSGQGLPQEQLLTLIVRPVVYLAEALPAAPVKALVKAPATPATTPVRMVAEGKAVLSGPEGDLAASTSTATSTSSASTVVNAVDAKNPAEPVEDLIAAAAVTTAAARATPSQTTLIHTPAVQASAATAAKTSPAPAKQSGSFSPSGPPSASPSASVRRARAEPPMPTITPSPVKPVQVGGSVAALPEIPLTNSVYQQRRRQAALPKTATPKTALAGAGAAAPALKPGAMAPVAVLRGRPETSATPSLKPAQASGATATPQHAAEGKLALVQPQGAGTLQEDPSPQTILDLLSNAPKGKLVERPGSDMPPAAPAVMANAAAQAPLPKDPAKVDWNAWDAELEASVAQGGGGAAFADMPVDSVLPTTVPPPAGAKVMQKPSGVQVFRGAPGVKISPAAMKRLMELDARQERAKTTAPAASKDGSLLGQLRDKAHMQGVMMVYDKGGEQRE